MRFPGIARRGRANDQPKLGSREAARRRLDPEPVRFEMRNKFEPGRNLLRRKGMQALRQITRFGCGRVSATRRAPTPAFVPTVKILEEFIMHTRLAAMTLATLAGMVLALPGHAERGEQSGHGRASANPPPSGHPSQRTRPTAPGTQQNFSLSGHPTQRIKPSEMRGSVRPDGSYSVITGQQRDAKGRIVGPHSHGVLKDGNVVYSRTAGGTVVHDDAHPPAMTRARTASPPPAPPANRPVPRGGGARPDGRLGGTGGGIGMLPRGGGGGPPWTKK
jgi:hypothetical protein